MYTCKHLSISRVSCQKGPTRHAYAWQIWPFWQDTLDIWLAIYHCSVDDSCKSGIWQLSLRLWRLKAYYISWHYYYYSCQWTPKVYMASCRHIYRGQQFHMNEVAYMGQFVRDEMLTNCHFLRVILPWPSLNPRKFNVTFFQSACHTHSAINQNLTCSAEHLDHKMWLCQLYHGKLSLQYFNKNVCCRTSF